jgi:metabolite-proton symporter
MSAQITMHSETKKTSVEVRKVACASFIGTLIEYFDFFIFGTASALIFNKVFFPALDPLIGTLASFATFGVAFVARPVGGVVFGHFGDRVGRKTMLVVSLALMGSATALVGLLPTYAQIGIWAPLLLVVSRMLQGAAVGGEWSGAVLMAVEHAPPGKRAFYGSWPLCGVPAGLTLATASFYLVQMLPPGAMISWGWRIPFVASVVLVVLGVYIRLRISESPVFRVVRDRGEQARFPAVEVLRRARTRVVIAVLSFAVNAVVFYMATVYALSYGAKEGTSRGTILLAVCVAAVLQIFTTPAVAVLADRYGRRPVLLAGTVLAGIVAFPFYWLLNTGNFVAILVAMIVALPIVHALTYTPLASFLPELFETRLRYSGSAIGYTVGAMIWSGPTPFVSAALFSWAQDSWPLAMYVIVAGVVTFAAVFAARETYRDDLSAGPKQDRADESDTHRRQRRTTAWR